MTWKLAVLANGVVWLAYLMIGITIMRALWRTGQLRTNLLGLATGLIFLSCAGGHGEHVLHLLVTDTSAAARSVYDWHLLAVDMSTAVIGVWYWTLRSHYRTVLDGPSLFADVKARQRQALEINDNIVQGLSVARYAFESGEHDDGMAALDRTLGSARELMGDLLDNQTVGQVRPGDLVRAKGAALATTSGE